MIKNKWKEHRNFSILMTFVLIVYFGFYLIMTFLYSSQSDFMFVLIYTTIVVIIWNIGLYFLMFKKTKEDDIKNV